jgi:hypothetical protein
MNWYDGIDTIKEVIKSYNQYIDIRVTNHFYVEELKMVTVYFIYTDKFGKTSKIPVAMNIKKDDVRDYKIEQLGI